MHLVKQHVDELVGFGVSSVATPGFMLAGIATTLFETALVAIVSGVVGALAAHFTRKLIKKFKL